MALKRNAVLLPRIFEHWASPDGLVYNTGHGYQTEETARRNHQEDGQGKGVYVRVAALQLSQGWRKVKQETLGNLTQLPPDVIEFIQRRLSGELDENAPHSLFDIVRSLPHGNVMAVLQTAQQLGLENLLAVASRPCRERDLIMALVVARVLSPRSKLSANTALNAETAKHKMAKHFDLTITANSFAYTRREYACHALSSTRPRPARSRHLTPRTQSVPETVYLKSASSRQLTLQKTESNRNFSLGNRFKLGLGGIGTDARTALHEILGVLEESRRKESRFVERHAGYFVKALASVRERGTPVEFLANASGWDTFICRSP